MKNIMLSLSAVAMGGAIIACSNGNNKAPQNTTTYGLDKPAIAAYSIYTATESSVGLLRLNTTSSGMTILSFNLIESHNFNLIGSVSNFNADRGNCLPSTPMKGSVNNIITSDAKFSLTNCIKHDEDSMIAATATVISNGEEIFNLPVFLFNIPPVSTTTFKNAATTLDNTSPSTFNQPVQIIGNLVTSVAESTSVFSSYTPLITGGAFGEIINTFVTGNSQTFGNGGVSGQASFSWVDSTSAFITFNNLNLSMYESTIDGQSMGIFGSQLKCNMVSNNMIIDGKINPLFLGFITGCTGDITATPGYGSVQTISGTIFNIIANNG